MFLSRLFAHTEDQKDTAEEQTHRGGGGGGGGASLSLAGGVGTRARPMTAAAGRSRPATYWRASPWRARPWRERKKGRKGVTMKNRK